MSFHDQSKVSGVTEACKYNDHSDCNNPRCACTCHRAPVVEVPIEATPALIAAAQRGGLIKACPTCGLKRPSNEVFCRVDGSRLSSLLCKVCGAAREKDDKFCWACGVDVNAIGEVKLPQVVVEQPPFEYDKTILAELQKATRGDNGAQTHPEVVPPIREGQVIEQVNGPGGKFILKDRANPNKIRVGGRLESSAPIQTESDASGDTTDTITKRTPIRLPVKPS